MSSFVFVVILATIAIGVQAEESEFYPDSWLHLDVKAIIDNDRLFKKFSDCIVDDKAKQCPKDALQLKRMLPEVVETECAKCSPAHIAKAKEASAYVCKSRPNEFLAIFKKIDPTGEIRTKFEKKFGAVPECSVLFENENKNF